MLTLRVRVLDVRLIRRGDVVGYGGAFRAERRLQSVILGSDYGGGAIAVGFPAADGCFSATCDKALCGIDINGPDECRGHGRGFPVRVGDEAHGEDVASTPDTTSEEVLAGLTMRLARVYHRDVGNHEFHQVVAAAKRPSTTILMVHQEWREQTVRIRNLNHAVRQVRTSVPVKDS